MFAIGRSWFTGLADSIWARPVQVATGMSRMDIDSPVRIATAMDIDSTPSPGQPRPEILKPKRKLAGDAVVEEEKRRCGYLSRILRPVRRMKPNTQQSSLLDETPTFLYQSPVKAERKRPCSSISEVPTGKKAFRYDPYVIPARELQFPLLLRRPNYIFPTAEGKHSPDEGFEQAPSKRLNKEQDHHTYDEDNRLPPQSNQYPNQGQEKESTSSPTSGYCSTRPLLFSNTSNIPIFIFNTSTASRQPFNRHLRRSRIPRPVTFRLESLKINREEWDMDGVETSSTCSNASNSSTRSDDSMDIETPNQTSRPRSFFLRQIENLMSRPPQLFPRYGYPPRDRDRYPSSHSLRILPIQLR